MLQENLRGIMKYRAEVEAVQWKGTDESWDEVVELYQGVETVAFRTDDGGLSVETEDGREQVPIGYWVVKNGMGVISLVARTSSTCYLFRRRSNSAPTRLAVSCW